MASQRVAVLAAAIVLAEAVALLVVGAAELGVGLARGHADTAVPASVLFAAFGAGLLAVGFGLSAGRRWARAPAVVAQVLAVPVAVSLIQAGRSLLGIGLATCAVVGLIAAARAR